MSIISASTLTTTALQLTADTAGTLVFRTGATPTTALTLNADQSATFAGTVNFGTAGFTNLSITGVATFAAGTVSLPSITTAGDTNTGIFFPAADTIAFTEGGAESMRIDSSGNVGIGTSSPGQRLDVNGGRSYFAANNEPYSIGVRYNGSTNGAFIGSPSADTLTISSWGGTERMRIDSSGNVGIACTPSAWGSAYKPIQFGLGGSIHGRTDTTAIILGQNTYRDSSNDYRYIQTTAAGLYTLGTGIHSWFGAASGTAGNVVTFTQVLAISRSNSLALEGATSQAGTGITFPATQSASSDANTLDDYEEGTWTPTIGMGTGTSTGSSGEGTYVKIGRQVTVTVFLNVGTISAGGKINTINGLPFTTRAGNDQAVGLSRENALTGFGWELRASSAGTSLLIRRVTDNEDAVSTGMNFIGTVTYFV
jgi:hypothetical protein